MRGPKPKPTALKMVMGNPGKRRLNHLEPKPRLVIPTCPAHLQPTAKAEWKRLARQMHQLGVLSELDRAVLAAYCQAYSRWVEAERRLKATPPLLKTPAGYVHGRRSRMMMTTSSSADDGSDHGTSSTSWLRASTRHRPKHKNARLVSGRSTLIRP